MSAVTMDHTGVGVVCLWLSAAMCVVHGESHYVNVALNKTYSQSSTYPTQGPSSMAANGDTSGVFPANCIHTYLNDYNPWWEVDLGRTYPVYNMDVWARSAFQHRANSNISVDGQWCASITSFPTNTRKKEVTCPTIMYGRTVRVTRLNYTGNEEGGQTLNLCEVQIWDCQAGWYGKQCNTNCSVGCEDAVCDRQTGHCSECKPGFYGASCNFLCQYPCLNNECTQDSGLCEACQENYQGKTCPECKDGFYGQSCVPCPPLCVNNTCDKTTGHCAACPDGYRGDTCSECKDGFYGQSCVPCPPLCVNNTCNQTTGHCDACPDGYQGDTCPAVINNTTNNTPVIVGAVVSVIVLILLVVFIVIFIKRRRKYSAKSRALGSNTCNTAQNSVELGQPERAGSSPLSFAPAIATGGRSASTADRGQTSAVSQGTEDGPEHYEQVVMSEQNERVDYEPVAMAEAENGVHSDDLTATSHKTEADSANPYDTPAVQYHNTGDVHLYHSWGNPQALQ